MFENELRALLSIIAFALLTGVAFALANYGIYGWSLFIALPVIAGGLGTWTFRPRTLPRSLGVGAGVGAAGCLLFLLLGREGFICVLMAIPVVVPLAMLGSMLLYLASSLRRQPAAMLLVLPLSLIFDSHAKPPLYSVTTSLIVNAPPERVWTNVIAFPDITARPDWLLRTGLAYPLRTRLEGSGVGAPRDCDLSTGTVKEHVIIWDQPRLLRFSVTATPPAMKEMGLYGPIYPKHLHGYYISKQGQFTLTALAGGRTLLVGTSWYEHGLWPAEYWRLWTDVVVHHIHQRVLGHIRTLSETPRQQNPIAHLRHQRS